ncbi:cytochrome c oxidase assembly protein [Gordonia sp. SID5947]|uniref:cytochrome c oxidase assembly protein n=1 Tax=Gordonia sp. SID5947 TaxID=2690315 RepID=UPI001F236D95|nr:cytochrome c oxidase assembly protein [Gordonia sp. SID5947]
MHDGMMPDFWTSWTATPIVWVLLAVATLAYAVGAIRVGHWPVSRSASWVLAMALFVVSLNSGVASFAHHLFWMHMVVHLLMITVIPLFLVLAQPIRLCSLALGARGGTAVERAMTSSAIRFITAPMFTVPLYTAVLVLTHLTGFQQQMSEHMWIHQSELVLYLVSGYLLLLPLVGDELTGHDYSYAARFVTLLVAMGADTFVGVILMLTSYEIAPAFSASRAGWGAESILNPSAMADQSAAGAIMWWAGDGLMMCLLVFLAWEWIRAEGLGRGRQDSAARHLGKVRPSFLESARRDALGTDSVDVDDDEAALAAYNARLAAMHGKPPTEP